ncbi:hypothetical protein ACFQS6_08480 [Xanthomonas populi]|nr:hypothetical protein [Xanthomonas populi]
MSRLVWVVEATVATREALDAWARHQDFVAILGARWHWLKPL